MYPSLLMKRPYSRIWFLLLLTIYYLGCAPKEMDPDPVAQVIGSMSDTLPQLLIPADADPEDENWTGIDLAPKSPVLPKYPSEEQQRFLLPPGYRIEAVLTEPQIEQPGAIAFDGNGRMFVLELRTYMLTADSDGTLEPVSRISRWEDLDNDGVYEKGTVFVDSLIFPRFVLPYGKDCILTMESDADNVYRYTDTDGDGKADKKDLFTTRFGRSGNVEHQQAFLYWGMDNWLYSTVNAFRVRETPQGIIREKTGYNKAQWGITHDDDGKLWFQGGASGLPSHFQFPVLYGNFEVEGEFAEGFNVPWGSAIKIADMQGGMDEVRQPDGSLNRVTGAAGNDVYRGDRLPKALYGQYFYGEPVARIVRQVNPVVSEGLTTLHNVYQDQKSEFLRSTDPLFRPVDMTTAPDGTLYITDMYHGIIQEGQWAQKGSYLRTKIEQYQLDKVVGLGRIWRITYTGMDRDKTRPGMLDKRPSELVRYLEHPNGWWRDKAQQLIVLSRDKSVASKLEDMARTKGNLTARFHALWCLEGLDALPYELVADLLEDKEPRMRIQALRASETLYKSGIKKLGPLYEQSLSDKDEQVVIQAMLTAKFLELPGADASIRSAMASKDSKGVQVIGGQILNPPDTGGFWARAGATDSEEEMERLEKGAVIFNELCVQCHGNNGMGTPLGNGQLMAPPLAGSERVQAHPEYVVRTLLHGMSGPLEGKNYASGIMVGMGEQSDEWIAAIASYIRYNLSNEAALVSPQQVAEVRAKSSSQQGPYQYHELLASVPRQLVPAQNWKVTASHNAPTRIGGTSSTASAFNYEGWTTGENQKKGMWFQVSLPEAENLTELQFNSPPVRKGWGPDAPPPIHTYPRSFEIQVSKDGKTWSTVSSGKGESPDIAVNFNPVKTRFLRILHTGIPSGGEEHDIPWSMKQMKLFAIPDKQEHADTNLK